MKASDGASDVTSQLDLPPERMQQLQAEYANKYIAFCEDEVVAADESMAVVIAEADAVCPEGNYLVRFIQAEDVYVLNVSDST
jgi:hypothetical protein